MPKIPSPSVGRSATRTSYRRQSESNGGAHEVTERSGADSTATRTTFRGTDTKRVGSAGPANSLASRGTANEAGLPPDAVVPALISFNGGVELGQLAIVSLAYPLRAWVRGRDWERRAIRVCASAIGLMALYWFVERTLLA